MPGASLRDRVWEALGAVMDPELDEAVTELGFVEECRVDEAGVASVRLRLPTYFCAPNFAWMMVSDAHDAVSGVQGVTRAEIRLEDHFAGDEINAGVAGAAGFAATFEGEASTDLSELRAAFRAKAYIAALERLWRAGGLAASPPVELVALRLADVADTPDKRRLLRRRGDLGLGERPGDPLFVDEHGEPITAGALPGWLRRARMVRVNIEGNAELCRALLRTRYHLGELERSLAGEA